MLVDLAKSRPNRAGSRRPIRPAARRPQAPGTLSDASGEPTQIVARQQHSGESAIRELWVDTARSAPSARWEKTATQHCMKRVRGGARCETPCRAYVCSFGWPPQLNTNTVQWGPDRAPTARPSVISADLGMICGNGNIAAVSPWHAPSTACAELHPPIRFVP
ncbi:hypothetical protein VTO73DRAFT_6050 [Trametes versicolor]